jgi:hypothetical protein
LFCSSRILDLESSQPLGLNQFYLTFGCTRKDFARVWFKLICAGWHRNSDFPGLRSSDRPLDGGQVMRRFLILATVFLATSPFLSAQNVPAGTVIPVMLTTTLDSSKAKAGDQVTGKIMETVPLATGVDIPKGAKIVGHVASVQTGNETLPSILAVQFDKIAIHGREMPMRANLRALATMMAVYDAQVPLFEPDTTPRSAVLLTPVGGEASFQPDNPEKARRTLMEFSGPPAAGCGSRIDQEGGTGALWVFSPYACGTYGFGKGLVIVSDGSKEPEGNIVLTSRKNVSVHAGSGWLLRVASGASESGTAY